MLNQKNILITGGTGSFGQKCVEVILRQNQPNKIIIYSRDELKQYEMAQRFSPKQYPCMRYFIGDVRDRDRLRRAFSGVNVVIHAAALKQVPAAEYNPIEAVKTNVNGAINVIDAAIDQKVKKVIALSTDKAANPINLYGATKLCSDKLFIAGNAYVGRDQTRFAVVRYGNVVGSRGSVIPFFLKKKNERIVPITDPRMTRFWITLEQGVKFVLHCLEIMVGGELFIPKLPTMNIMDLVDAICPDCKTEVIGIRPGEKLHEVMVPRDEACNTIEHEHYYVIKPAFWFFERRYDVNNGGKPVSKDFEYNSENNPWRLSATEMKKFVKETTKK
jgi:UDP-N-acetylglucosamine 4,6-dehydratase